MTDSPRGGRRPVQRLIGVLLVAAVLVIGIVILLRWEEYSFFRRFRLVVIDDARYLEREIEAGELAEHAEGVRDAETWILERAETTRPRLLDRLDRGGRREKLVALHLLWKLDGALDPAPSSELFWRAFPVRPEVEALLDRLPREASLYRVEGGPHAAFVGDALHVRIEDDRVRLWRSAVLGSPWTPEAFALNTAYRRAEAGPPPARSWVRKSTIETEAKERFLRELGRALSFPDCPELVRGDSEARDRDRLRVFLAGAEPSHAILSASPWQRRAYADISELAKTRFDEWSDVDDRELADLIVSVARHDASTPMFVHLVLELAAREMDAVSSSRCREALRERAGVDLWFAAAMHVLGESEPLSRHLKNGVADWPPLDDPRIGWLMAARPRAVLPEFVLRLWESDSGGHESFAAEMSGATLDAFSEGERARLRRKLESAADEDVVRFLLGTLRRPADALDDIPWEVLERVESEERARFLETLADRNDRRHEGSYQELLEEMRGMSVSQRLERFESLKQIP